MAELVDAAAHQVAGSCNRPGSSPGTRTNYDSRVSRSLPITLCLCTCFPRAIPVRRLTPWANSGRMIWVVRYPFVPASLTAEPGGDSLKPRQTDRIYVKSISCNPISSRSTPPTAGRFKVRSQHNPNMGYEVNHGGFPCPDAQDGWNCEDTYATEIVGRRVDDSGGITMERRSYSEGWTT